MGKAEIVQGGTGGYYSIRLAYDRARVTRRLAALANDITVMEGRLATLDTEIVDLEQAYYIASHSSPPPSTVELIALYTPIAVKKQQRSFLRLQVAALEKRKAFLEDPANVPPDEVVSAWCADLSESLSGTVGTIEPNGEPNRAKYIIQPGYENNHVYSKPRDGQVQGIFAATPESSFFNKALFPGWQKWKPTYRVGTLTAIDSTGNKGNVSFDVDYSREHPLGLQLNINQASGVSNAPFQYMSCDCDAFSVGDQVVVKFTGQNFASPVIVGFEDHPKACGGFSVKLYLDNDLVNPVDDHTDLNFYLTVIDSNYNYIVDISRWNPEAYFKRKADGSRLKVLDSLGNDTTVDVPVYNPSTKKWEFDGWIWNPNAPTHPSTVDQIWSNSQGKYVAAGSTVLILVGCTHGVDCIYRPLTTEQRNAGVWPRTMNWDTYMDCFVAPSHIVLPIPYFQTTIGAITPAADLGTPPDTWTIHPADEITRTGSVASSVPWKVQYGVNNSTILGTYRLYEAAIYKYSYVHGESDDAVLDGTNNHAGAMLSANSDWQFETTGEHTIRVNEPGPPEAIDPGYPGETFFLELVLFKGSLSVGYSIDDTYDRCLIAANPPS